MGSTRTGVVKWVGDITPKIAPATVHGGYQVLAGVLHLAVRRPDAREPCYVELPKIEEEECTISRTPRLRGSPLPRTTSTACGRRPQAGRRDRAAELAVEHDNDGRRSSRLSRRRRTGSRFGSWPTPVCA